MLYFLLYDICRKCFWRYEFLFYGIIVGNGIFWPLIWYFEPFLTTWKFFHALFSLSLSVISYLAQSLLLGIFKKLRIRNDQFGGQFGIFRGANFFRQKF